MYVVRNRDLDGEYRLSIQPLAIYFLSPKIYRSRQAKFSAHPAPPRKLAPSTTSSSSSLRNNNYNEKSRSQIRQLLHSATPKAQERPAPSPANTSTRRNGALTRHLQCGRRADRAPAHALQEPSTSICRPGDASPRVVFRARASALRGRD